MSWKQMSDENVKKILHMPPYVKKELNEAFGLFLASPLKKYPNTEATDVIERNLYQGQISSTNLKTVLRALGYEPRRDEIKKLLIHVNSAEQIDIFQFLLILIKKMERKDSYEELLKSFRLFDKTDCGLIGFEELKALSLECGYEFEDQQILEMIAEADRDQDNMINEEEFLRVMRHRKRTHGY